MYTNIYIYVVYRYVTFLLHFDCFALYIFFACKVSRKHHPKSEKLRSLTKNMQYTPSELSGIEPNFNLIQKSLPFTLCHSNSNDSCGII